MPTIDIDFEVYKALTVRREVESDTYNDVVRGLLGLQRSKASATAGSAKANGANKAWVSKGVMFPEGTEFRANYKGQMKTARIKNGRLVLDGKGASSSLSHAARLVTNTSVDGWTFWEVKRPADIEWRKSSELRNGAV
jgi:hypothetical protein